MLIHFVVGQKYQSNTLTFFASASESRDAQASLNADVLRRKYTGENTSNTAPPTNQKCGFENCFAILYSESHDR